MGSLGERAIGIEVPRHGTGHVRPNIFTCSDSLSIRPLAWKNNRGTSPPNTPVFGHLSWTYRSVAAISGKKLPYLASAAFCTRAIS